jgi:leucine-rich repeat transmembrane neuronal protein 1/2
MIIGIVAGALIAVILVILLVLWIKSNGDRSYKTEHDIKYGHGPNAALLGNSGTNSSQRGHHPSAPLDNGQQGNGYHGNNSYNNSYNQGSSQQYNNNNGASNMQLNGSLRQNGSERNGSMSAGLVQKPKRNSKDIKEWYV